MNKVRLTVLVVAIAGMLGATAVASTSTATISLRTTSLGKVLVASGGRTVYLFTADKGKSACYGQCAGYWPPLIATHATVGAGLHASLLGTTKRTGGERQITYAGHPLYFFSQDKKAGNVNGEGIVHFGGSWWAVSATGVQVKAKR